MSWTIGSAIISFILSVIAIVANFVDMGAFGDFMVNYSYIFHYVTALGMVTLLLFVDFNTISPGANDNLTVLMRQFALCVCMIGRNRF